LTFKQRLNGPKTVGDDLNDLADSSIMNKKICIIGIHGFIGFDPALLANSVPDS
jgi:anaerobic glycerol-3-phosphate dehydrogenase